MRIESSITIYCDCGLKCTDISEYGALNWLLDHIQLTHKEKFDEIEKRARVLSRVQNGCRYYDDDTTNGWLTAQSNFRRAFRCEALKELVQ